MRRARETDSPPRRVLVVCTGNICRSPMAAALLERRLAGSERGIEVRSAGVAARPGLPASENARLAVLEKGIDLAGHRSTLLTSDLVRWADLILVMERIHREIIGRIVPEALGRVFLIAGVDGKREGEVPDPIGTDLESYRQCLETIQRSIDAVVKRFWP